MSANVKRELFGFLGMILGIVSLFPLAAPICIVGLVFSAMGLRKAIINRTRKRNAILGLVLSGLVLIGYSVFLPLYYL